jgi:hypothetical protein
VTDRGRRAIARIELALPRAGQHLGPPPDWEARVLAAIFLPPQPRRPFASAPARRLSGTPASRRAFLLFCLRRSR